MKTTTQELTVRRLPLEHIAFSPTNPRQRMAGPEFEELKASIAAQGVQVPVKVRPIARSTGKFKYELIMGERRVRACQALKLPDIPAVVEAVDDLGAFKAQLAENLHRQDLSALEEGAAFATAIEKFALTREQVAEQFGVKRSTVYSRLRLRGLRPEVRSALVEHKIPDSIAGLIATIPDPKEQVRAAQELGTDGRYGEVATFDAAKQHIEEEFRCSLKEAPFDVKNATLDVAAGACTVCPKRSGNLDPEGLSPNVCTDPGCYARKVRAHGEVAAKALVEKRGLRLLPAAAMEKQWDYYGRDLCFFSKFVAAHDKPWQDKEHRTVEALMNGSEVKPAVAISPKGEAWLVFPKKDVKARLVELNIVKREHAESGPQARGPDKAAAAAERQKRLDRAARAALAGVIVGKLESGKLSDRTEAFVWRDLLDWMLELGEVNDHVIGKRRGWKESFGKQADRLDAAGVRALVFEAHLCKAYFIDAYESEWDRARLESVAKVLGLDRKAIEKTARAAFEKANPLSPMAQVAKALGVDQQAIDEANGKGKAKNVQRSTSNVERPSRKRKEKKRK